MLVVDDDPTVAEVVAGYLERAGFGVDRVADGPAALARAAVRRPDLVVLDLMLPGMDGLEVCRRLRAEGPVPVIMLTARGDEEDRILGLEVGADDYVTKPFSPRELVLRVTSVLRRSRAAAAREPVPETLRAGALRAEPAAHRAAKNGTELALTVREFDLLVFFLRHPGRAFGREELMREVWGWDFGDLSTVTVHVRRLRAKIEDDPARPRLIQTVWGVGYRLEAGGEPEGGSPGDPAGDPGGERVGGPWTGGSGIGGPGTDNPRTADGSGIGGSGADDPRTGSSGTGDPRSADPGTAAPRTGVPRTTAPGPLVPRPPTPTPTPAPTSAPAPASAPTPAPAPRLPRPDPEV
ncbi:response regulator transcription factor [Streptomyces sp. LD120]|uniref:Response regulator transcription factor n=1 Tax=Streptomyces physcomitrii TaxID=2724184 RepID=A0ABX1GY36_9ACTN|nr:response regulator transcription factor [Streptomyces physcomitrii]